MTEAWPDTVRRLLLEVWQAQACQIRPDDWTEARDGSPGVLERLMKDNGKVRCSLEPAVDLAVERLASASTYTADSVWRAFPKLDRPHCTLLAAALLNARKPDA